MPGRLRGRTTRTARGALAGLLLLLPEAAYACDRCFGASGVDTPVTEGIGLAMLSLLGLTGLVMGGVVLFFANMQQRSRRLGPGTSVVTEDGAVLLSDEPG